MGKINPFFEKKRIFYEMFLPPPLGECPSVHTGAERAITEYPLRQKSKIFASSPRGRAKTALSETPVVKNTMAKKVEKSRKKSKRIMLTREKPAFTFSCEKGLWKNLWKMWKSQFRQRKSRNSASPDTKDLSNFSKKTEPERLQLLRVTETKNVKPFQFFFAEIVGIFMAGGRKKPGKRKILPYFL